MKKETKKEDYKVCSVCGKPYTGFGNNANPVNNGRCCDSCDGLVVIPRRINDIIYKDIIAKFGLKVEVDTE